MKQFFKFTLASMVGFFLSLALLMIFFFILMIFLVSGLQMTDKIEIKDESVLKIQLNYEVPERSIYRPFSNIFSPNLAKILGLNDIRISLEKASKDKNIKGIFLDLNNTIVGSYATLEPIRNSLLDFRKSGKFIIAHGDNISQKSFYLGSAADELYMTPSGIFELKGLKADLLFLKNTLDKLEIEVEVIRAGKYKSAGEMFMNDHMSQENKEQMSSLLNSIYFNILSAIDSSRNVPLALLDSLANNYAVPHPEEAKKYGLIDKIGYRSDVYSRIEELVSSGTKEKLNFINLRDYIRVAENSGNLSQNRIAVIYAVGEIFQGAGSDEYIGSENIVEALRKARENENVNAIVLRVDSPGGDALTSDIIWNEVRLTKLTKPLIVSMASLAASGGYYISCAADTIVAEPSTITGSIGVFGIIPNLKDFYSNKLGITFDGVKTGKYSDLGSINRPQSSDEKMIFQKEVDRIYELFISRVSEGRNMLDEDVREIAQGRVWTGLQAKEIGLVDELGGLDKAIDIAASLAQIENYKILEYPPVKKPLEELVNIISEDIESKYLQYKLGDNYKYYRHLQNVFNTNGVVARAPFDILID